MPSDIIADDAGKNSQPSQDRERAEKGAVDPAPIRADKLPSKEEEVEKARAMLEGRDPEVVELIDELKEADKLVEVAKDGETIRVNPDTLDAHMAAGWRIVDAEKADAAKAADAPSGAFVHPPRDDDRPSKADAAKPSDKPSKSK